MKHCEIANTRAQWPHEPWRRSKVATIVTLIGFLGSCDIESLDGTDVRDFAVGHSFESLESSCVGSGESVTIIYRDGFSGSGSLHGSLPEIGNLAWLAGPAWTVGNGLATIDDLEVDHAFLPFQPEAGHYYVLSITLAPGKVARNSWVGVGFANQPSVVDGVVSWWSNFHEGGRGTAPWMLKFHNGNIWTFTGPRANGGSNHGTFSLSPSRVEIVLDTTSSNWRVDWCVDGHKVRHAAYSSSPNINWVGFGVEQRHANIQVDDFSLVSVKVGAN